MTFHEAVTMTAKFYGLPVGRTGRMARHLFRLCAVVAAEEGRMHVPQFGIFYRKFQKARRVHAPPGQQEGQMTRIQAQESIGFRAAKALKRKKGKA